MDNLENIPNYELMMDHDRMRIDLDNEKIIFELAMIELFIADEIEKLKLEVFMEEIKTK
jgi:hypothetical protein